MTPPIASSAPILTTLTFAAVVLVNIQPRISIGQKPKRTKPVTSVFFARYQPRPIAMIAISMRAAMGLRDRAGVCSDCASSNRQVTTPIQTSTPESCLNRTTIPTRNPTTSIRILDSRGIHRRAQAIRTTTNKLYQLEVGFRKFTTPRALIATAATAAIDRRPLR